MFNFLHQPIRQKTLRLGLMAWMLIFVCGQIQASSHLHIDSHADELCAVCIQGQDQPTATNGAFTDRLSSIAYQFNITYHNAYLQSATTSPYSSRAPPQS